MILGDEQVRAAILEFLIKKGRWGAHYFPIDTLVNWMGRKVERNGKRLILSATGVGRFMLPL
jgi:hypothetical protein